MSGQWQMPLGAGYAGSMPGTGDDGIEFFQIVPPTPRNQFGPLNLHANHVHTTSDPSVHLPNPSFDDHLLPNTQNTLRSHRSMSSITSLDSHISTYSNFSTYGEPATESLSSEYDPSDSLHTRPNTYTHARGHSLSIDPKLFQPKMGNEMDVDVEEEGDEDGEGMKTAVPKLPKSPAAIGSGGGRGKKGKSVLGDVSMKGLDSAGRKKVSHARKAQQGPEHIPRPRNAFILFRKHVVDSKLIPTSVEMRHQNVSIITAKMWSEAPAEQKAQFNELARIEKEEHMIKYPGYRYQPVYRRTNVIRRRVRKDEAEEEKCRSVAELLLKGKSGEALEHEIKEKIKRGPESSSGSSKRTKSASRRSSAACELSKGALRALRAQARSQNHGSGDWSDLSVPVSRGTSIDQDSVSMGQGHTRQNSIYDSPGVDMAYMTEAALGGIPGYFTGHASIGHQGGDGMGYMHPGMEWAYPDQGNNMIEQHGDGIDYAQLARRTDAEYSQVAPQAQYMYAQPLQHVNQPIPDFLTYDHALPFSPTMQSFSHNQPGLRPHAQHAELDVPMSMAFASAPSPTTVMYGGGVRATMSARWDTRHFLPSSEVSLEGLGFGDERMMLDGFVGLGNVGEGAEMASHW